jgi:hypothetical protein
LSLVFALVQLNTLIGDKVHRDHAEEELVAAARYQAEAKDLDGAWKLTDGS